MSDHFDPDSGSEIRAIDRLLRSLEAQESGVDSRVLLPRKHRVWLVRKDDSYSITVGRGESGWPLSLDALSDLAHLLDVPARLMARLKAMPANSRGEYEDVRLLNRMLWYTNDDRWGFRAFIAGGKVTRIRSLSYVAVRLKSLASRVKAAEAAGDFYLVRYEHEGDWLRLVLRSTSRAPIGSDDPAISLPPHQVWFSGVVVDCDEDGAHAVTVVPALVSGGGNRTLPILHSNDALRKIRHSGKSPEALSSEIVRTAQAVQKAAPYKEMLVRLLGMTRARFTAAEVPNVLASANVRFPTNAIRDNVIRRASTQPNTHLGWLAVQMLAAADNIRSAARLRFEIDVGRLVWSRGIAQLSKRPAPPSP